MKINLSSKINIPKRFGGEIVEKVFDYVLLYRDDWPRQTNTLRCFTSALLGCLTISSLIIYPGYKLRERALLQQNYPTHQEQVNFFGERAIRILEKEQTQRGYEEKKRKIEEQIRRRYGKTQEGYEENMREN